MKNQLDAYKAIKAFIALDDKIQHRSNRMTTRTTKKQYFNKLVSRLKELNYKYSGTGMST